MKLEEQNAIVEQRRRHIWRALGEVSDDVVSASTPRTGSFWPASTLGKFVIIKGGDGMWLATDGLTDIYDPTLHDDPPAYPLDFELVLEIGSDDPATKSEGAWPTVGTPPCCTV